MLTDELTSVLHAATSEHLREDIVAFARRLEFDTVSATVVVDHLGRESEFITLDNTPAAYRDEFENPDNRPRDPVMQHCKHQGVPIVWHQGTYTSVGQGDLWEVQASFGYRCGIALALHLPYGHHFFLGVDRDQALPRSADKIRRLVAELCLFAVHAQAAAQRLLLPGASDQRTAPALTPRELECLRWTMEGKTAWELGRILGISEHTAIRHINRATHKLGAVNKHQAVLRALRLKLIR